MNSLSLKATPKLVEDDILTDILGEIDINNVDIRPGPITAVRRSSKERHEKKLVHQFMQEFTKSAVVEKDAQEDDVYYDTLHDCCCKQIIFLRLFCRL